MFRFRVAQAFRRVRPCRERGPGGGQRTALRAGGARRHRRAVDPRGHRERRSVHVDVQTRARLLSVPVGQVQGFNVVPAGRHPHGTSQSSVVDLCQSRHRTLHRDTGTTRFIVSYYDILSL